MGWSFKATSGDCIGYHFYLPFLLPNFYWFRSPMVANKSVRLQLVSNLPHPGICVWPRLLSKTPFLGHSITHWPMLNISMQISNPWYRLFKHPRRSEPMSSLSTPTNLTACFWTRTPVSSRTKNRNETRKANVDINLLYVLIINFHIVKWINFFSFPNLK